MHKDIEFRKESIYNKEDKIVFLDIDGVIQCTQKRFDHDMDATCFMLARKYNDNIFLKMKPYDVCAAYYDWSNIAIGIIHELLETTHSKIVLSSDWRESKSFDEMKALFRLYNLDRYFIDICNPKISKKDAMFEYINEHKIDKYVVIDDKNFYHEFGEKHRNTRNLININDFYYIKYLLNNNISIHENDEFIDIDNLVLKYHVYNIDGKGVMFTEEYSTSEFDYSYLLEYIFNYMIVRKNIDLYIFKPNDLKITNLNVNGYKAYDGNYYIYKDIYKSNELRNTVDKILCKTRI